MRGEALSPTWLPAAATRVRCAALAVAVALFLVAPGADARAAPSGARIVAAGAQTPTGRKDDDTPWRFFLDNVRHADSLAKWLALIFFTIVLIALYASQFLTAVLAAVGVLALFSHRVRSSRLVRGGFALVLAGLVPLVVAGRFLSDNPLGFGFLYAFTRPVAAGMMAVGAMLALLKTDKRMKRDIAALINAASDRRPVWPDHPPLPQVDHVARHGSRAAHALVALLPSESDDASADGSPDLHVEQQVELTLCRIYGVLPASGERSATPGRHSKKTGGRGSSGGERCTGQRRWPS